MCKEAFPNCFPKKPSYLDFFKKFRRSIELSSPGVFGCLFFSFCLIFCLFLLDYRTASGGFSLHGHSLLVTWFGLNGSSSPSSAAGSGNGNGKVGLLEKGGGRCDIFDGNWVWDENYPLYQSEDCMLMDDGFRCSENGRPDNFYTKWRWQPKDCNLPRGCYFQEGAEVKMNMSVASAFHRSIQTLVDWMSHEVNLKKTLVFFRSYSPVHFRGGDWKTGGSCHLETLPELVSSQLSSETSVGVRTTTDVLVKLVKTSRLQNVELLNVSQMTSQRKDGHSSLYYLGPKAGPAPLHRQDCSHWCLPGVPDTWNELLYAALLKKELADAQNSYPSPL